MRTFIEYIKEVNLQDEWIAGNGMGVYVGYYNPTGHVMHFVGNPEEAQRTTDSYEAARWAKVATDLYKKHGMKLMLAPERID